MEQSFVEQFNEYVRTHGELTKARDIIKEDFIKNTVHNHPASIIQNLGEYSKHVALILVKKNDRIVRKGTFFLLTESLGLTCYRMVEDIRKSNCYKIEIRFNHTQMRAEELYFPAELVSYSKMFNYAFLRVIRITYPDCPGGLLQHLALPSQDGAVAIIGHPQGQYKQIHVCSVMNFNSCEDRSYPSYVHVLTMHSFLQLLSSKLVINKTCPYDGASGAPMFNEHGELVAMHLGGYKVDDSATTKTVIEYGRSIVEIIIIGAVKIEDLRHEFLELMQRNEALRSYMSSSSHAPHMRNVITDLMKLGEVERKQIKLEEILTQVKHSKNMYFEMESPKIIQTMIVQGFPKWTPRKELESKKDEGKSHSWTFQIALKLEFTMDDEANLCNAYTQCDNFISQNAFTLGSLLSPRFYYKKNHKPSQLKSLGCYKCQQEECRACKYMEEGETFPSYQTRETHDIVQRIDCNSTHVIYVISCTECLLQYVGCTVGKLKERIMRHMSDTRNPNSKTPSMVSKHFVTVHKGDLKYLQFQGIQKVKKPLKLEARRRLLLNKEAFWIWKLKTLHPHGLNLKVDFAHRY